MPPSLCAFPEHEGYRHTPVSHQAAAGCQGPCAFEKADAQLQLHLLGLEAGYAVVAVNYRLSEESIFSACLHDQKAAIRWVRAQVWEFALDTPRIACWGDSAGGYYALTAHERLFEALSTGNEEDSSAVQVVVDW